ncbi:MAG: hypothetical protein P8X88_01910 [Gammaproteobacteria bacterium]
MNNKTNIIFNPMLWLAISLTLGLAPFSPEPHVWEKLKWIVSGAEGMRPIDWFDLLMHGTPWGMLLISIVLKVFKS